MNYIPNPGNYNQKDFDNDLNDYFRRIILKAHFQSERTDEYEGFRSQTNGEWIPKEIHHSVKTYIQAVKNDISSHQPDQIKNRKQNLSQGEKKELASLKDR